MPRRLSNVLALLCVGIFAAACTHFIRPSRPEIDAYLQTHAELPRIDKHCLDEGLFEFGMKQETVLFLLGKPHRIDTVKQPWAVQENWVYYNHGRKTFIMEEKHVVGILTR